MLICKICVFDTRSLCQCWHFMLALNLFCFPFRTIQFLKFPFLNCYIVQLPAWMKEREMTSSPSQILLTYQSWWTTEVPTTCWPAPLLVWEVGEVQVVVAGEEETWSRPLSPSHSPYTLFRLLANLTLFTCRVVRCRCSCTGARGKDLFATTVSVVRLLSMFICMFQRSPFKDFLVAQRGKEVSPVPYLAHCPPWEYTYFFESDYIGTKFYY